MLPNFCATEISFTLKFGLLCLDLLSVTRVTRQLVCRFPSQVLDEVINFATALLS